MSRAMVAFWQKDTGIVGIRLGSYLALLMPWTQLREVCTFWQRFRLSQRLVPRRFFTRISLIM